MMICHERPRNIHHLLFMSIQILIVIIITEINHKNKSQVSTVFYLVLPFTLLLDIDLTLTDNTVLLNNIQVDAIHSSTPVPGLIISPSFLTFLPPTSFLLLYNITLNKPDFKNDWGLDYVFGSGQSFVQAFR